MFVALFISVIAIILGISGNIKSAIGLMAILFLFGIMIAIDKVIRFFSRRYAARKKTNPAK